MFLTPKKLTLTPETIGYMSHVEFTDHMFRSYPCLCLYIPPIIIHRIIQ